MCRESVGSQKRITKKSKRKNKINKTHGPTTENQELERKWKRKSFVTVGFQENIGKESKRQAIR